MEIFDNGYFLGFNNHFESKKAIKVVGTDRKEGYDEDRICMFNGGGPQYGAENVLTKKCIR